MKRSTLLIVSHLAVLGIGYAAHRANSPRETGATRDERAAPARPGPARPEILAPGSVAYHRATWRALKTSRLPAAEGALLKRESMKEWMKKDLRSALIACAEEGTLGLNFAIEWQEVPIKGQEREMLDWINHGDFGLDGSMILQMWARHVGSENPELLIQLLPLVPAEFQERAIAESFGGAGVAGRYLSNIAAIPDENVRVTAWKAVLSSTALRARGSDPGDFMTLLARGDVPAEARKAGLTSFAEALVTNQTPAKSLEDFGKLSAADQAGIGKDLLAKAGRLGFAHPSAGTIALTMLSASGQWELIDQEGPAAINKMFKEKNTNAEAVSRWALELPARGEAAGTYRSAVAERFREDWAKGEEWVASLPEGWHRDQAYAQLAISAVDQPAKRDRAISRISDPRIREGLAK